VHANVRLPAIESIQLALTTSKGIIQRLPCGVPHRRKRGGAAWHVSFQLN